MSIEYNQYINEHVANVLNGLDWLTNNLVDIDEIAIAKAITNVINHDQSKWDAEEYKAYDDYFYGNNKTVKIKEAFDYAWLHHIHNNPHHWQYWILINDNASEGTKALEMPLEYVYEMIADWWSFSWKKGNLMEIFDWYDDHRSRIIFHKNTKKVVETILDNIKSILKMQLRKEQPSKFENEDETVEQVKLGDDNDILDHSDLKKDKEKKFGVPEEHKFPLPDADHVRSAIRFFNYVDPKYEKELAEAILKRMDEYGLSFEDFSIGDENRFKKYISEKYLAHHGIMGQKWGIKNGPPYPIGSQLKNKTPAKVDEIKNYKGKLYWLSESNMEGRTLIPRVPKNYFTENDYEDNQTPRLCFAPSVDQCLSAISQNLTGKTYTVYEPESMPKKVFKPNKGAVPDSEITGELWVKEPVKLKSVGSITVKGDDGKDGMKFEYGDHEAELYGWEYEWNDQLAPYGIQGQKWGIKNGPPYPLNSEDKGDLTKAYTKENLKNADKRNLDSWGKSADTNCLYISGISGSGKSTVALGLAENGDTVIHLDGYTEPDIYDGIESIQNKKFNSYLNDHVDNWKEIYMDKDKTKAKSKDYWNKVDEFRDAIETYSKEEFESGHKVIVEGVQITNGWLSEGQSEYKDKPFIYLTVIADAARSRAQERDSKQ